MVNNCVVFLVCTLFNDQEQEGRDTFGSKINVRKLTVYLRLSVEKNRFLWVCRLTPAFTYDLLFF